MVASNFLKIAEGAKDEGEKGKGREESSTGSDSDRGFCHQGHSFPRPPALNPSADSM